ncbi:hypothetical protein KDD30_18730 (plasmid) [Photobacterium sp. GJ3]|uniref:hypothetical protein n=1 Tax=Photobacterium sp. GJ3 TaxID=2829502 RepID=UPI001B8D3B09|nr:hypothetical protein [Photobacterium sp. GJ3]QUJ70168.1 hypothetical protein KDD30_18730 [Photobacterium sp. GJ3]
MLSFKRLPAAVVIVSAFLCMSASAYAGCSEMDAQCFMTTNGETQPQRCTITVCASASSYWSYWQFSDGTTLSHTSSTEESKIQINDKPGFLIPNSILKENLTCYGDEQMSTIDCAKDVLL